MFVQPLWLGWAKKHWDFALGYGFYAPIGQYDTETITLPVVGPLTVEAADNIGLGFWTHQIQGAASWYPWADKRMAVAGALTYEIHTEKEDFDLYAMLVKRLANTSDELLSYCRSAKIVFKEMHPRFGWVPVIERAEGAQPLVTRLIGLYMGANQNKGMAFNWLLDHIRDGQDKAYPRALVRLIEQAAVIELESPKAGRDHLLHPTSVRRAIEEVSKQQVKQAVSNEWPWLQGVKQRLQGESVPMSRRGLENLLRSNWDNSWSTHQSVRPPTDDARNLVNFLVELGIMRERGGDRLDAPDLYQSGLGLKRKGGVRRY